MLRLSLVAGLWVVLASSAVAHADNSNLPFQEVSDAQYNGWTGKVTDRGTEYLRPDGSRKNGTWPGKAVPKKDAAPSATPVAKADVFKPSRLFDRLVKAENLPFANYGVKGNVSLHRGGDELHVSGWYIARPGGATVSFSGTLPVSADGQVRPLVRPLKGEKVIATRRGSPDGKLNVTIDATGKIHVKHDSKNFEFFSNVPALSRQSRRAKVTAPRSAPRVPTRH